MRLELPNGLLKKPPDCCPDCYILTIFGMPLRADLPDEKTDSITFWAANDFMSVL